MDNKKRIEMIVQDLNELRDVIDYFSEYDMEIPTIELDIALQKMRDLYQHLRNLQTGNPTANTITKPEHIEEKTIIKKTSIPQPVISPITPPTPKAGNPGLEEIKQDIKTSKKIVAEKYEDHRKSIADNLSNKTGNDISSKMQSKAVGDLLKAIGINDRFTYTKELFGGRQDLFTDTINRLNKIESYYEARAYIDENFSWDEKNETAGTFFDLLKRKYQS